MTGEFKHHHLHSSSLLLDSSSLKFIDICVVRGGGCCRGRDGGGCIDTDDDTGCGTDDDILGFLLPAVSLVDTFVSISISFVSLLFFSFVNVRLEIASCSYFRLSCVTRSCSLVAASIVRCNCNVANAEWRN